MKRLKTVEQVEAALGGITGLCEITDANFKQAWHWSRRSKLFPANTYVAMQRALHRRGYRAPAHLWNMKGLDKRAA